MQKLTKPHKALTHTLCIPTPVVLPKLAVACLYLASVCEPFSLTGLRRQVSTPIMDPTQQPAQAAAVQVPVELLLQPRQQPAQAVAAQVPVELLLHSCAHCPGL